MINFNDNKTKRRIASVIIILIIIAMVVPTVLAWLI
jgi:DNA-binding transcriptional regulator of glucitol operon